MGNLSGMNRGFTIVELLIVVVIIAILASITIVSFNGIQTRANNSAVQSDLSAFKKKMDIYRLDNGRYPAVGTGQTQTAVSTALQGLKVTQTAYLDGANNVNLVYCTNSTGSRFAAVAWGKGSRDQGYVVSDNGSVGPYSFTHASGTITCPRVDASLTEYVWLFDKQVYDGWIDAVK